MTHPCASASRTAAASGSSSKFNWRKAAEETLAVYEEIVPPKRRTFTWAAGAAEPRT